MRNITYISAGAGSGKTYELTERLKNAILDGKTEPEEVILTTFTKAAASEFKEKAKAKFYEAGLVKEADRLNQALIGTLDSLANVFVKRYWYLLGISPKLNIIDEEDEQVYISESLSSLPTKEQNQFFHRFAEIFKIPEKHDDGRKYGIDYNFWKNDLKQIFNASRSYSIKDYSESIKASKELVESVTLSSSALNFDREELLSKLDIVDAISAGDKPSAARDNRIAESQKFRKVVNNSKSGQLEIGFALSEMISKGKFTTKGYQKNTDFSDLLLEAEKVWTCREVRELQFKYIDFLFEIALRWQEQYVEYKKEQHIIDYTDMEEYFLSLITEKKYESVQQDIKLSYKYLFVDEFQDSSPTQIKIFDRLSELVERTIWVGDYKQAIYGFRGSDTALVKAVTDRIEKLNGRQNETLGISRRSWPPVVEVSNAVFVPVFGDILRKEEVHLDVWDKLKEKYEAEKRDVLKLWTLTAKKNSERAEQVAGNIARMIKEEGIAPCDIGVLARSNSELTAVASSLKEFNIPSLVGDSDFKTSAEITLLNSLLSLVVNPLDTMARSTIAYLTQKDYSSAFILDKRFEAKSKDEKDSEFLAEIPLIKNLMAKRDFYKALSIKALVENIIIELDLYNVVKHWAQNDNSVTTFHNAIMLAKTYEEYCIQMSLPCTIYGFIEYIATVKTKASGSSDGVQLFTYHGSKGLEWKNVILLSLSDDILEDNNMINRNFYGVHTFHTEEPSSDNLYPPMNVCILPWIFGAKVNVPDSVKNLIFENPRYEQIKKNVVQEEKRLMYVAMTRAVESLILAANQENGLIRLKCLGVNALDSIPLAKECDALGINKNFTIENPCDMSGWKFKKGENKIINLSSLQSEYKKRDIQPSSYKVNTKVSASVILDSGKRIGLKADSDNMDKVGTCIHNIFCVLENNENVEPVNKIIKAHNLQKEIPCAEQIISSWKNLENFLQDKFSPKIKTYHELPFKQHINNQIFTGSIDFVWETKEGVVLVDFKSYPGSKNDVINPEHPHFAGMYAGQFECYENALKAAGKNVLLKMIYYHVLGVGVEITAVGGDRKI